MSYAASPVPYCPWHEYDWSRCCACCVERRAELRRIDNELRVHFARSGYSFKDRGRSDGCSQRGKRDTIDVPGLEPQYAAAT